MIPTYFKTCSLEMLSDMLSVSVSKLLVDRDKNVDAYIEAENKNIVNLLEKAIGAKRAEFLSWK